MIIERVGNITATYSCGLAQDGTWIHVYHFQGGRFGNHQVNESKISHKKNRLTGRARIHFDGYLEANQENKQ